MTELEQAARQLKELLIRPVDTIAEMYCYGMGDIDDALAALREALDHSADAGNKVSDHIAGGGKLMLTTEQAQQIEEALEDIVRVFKFETGTPVEALAAIRAARAQEQAEQEPVATVVDESEEQTNTMSWILSLPLPVGTKLYAAPVRTKDLTDAEINNIEPWPWGSTAAVREFARAAIAADRENNK